MSTDKGSDISLLLLRAEDLNDVGKHTDALELYRAILGQVIGAELRVEVDRRISELEGVLQSPSRSNEIEQETWVCPDCDGEVGIQEGICPFCERGLRDGTRVPSADRPEEDGQVRKGRFIVLVIIGMIVLIGGIWMTFHADNGGNRTAVRVTSTNMSPSTVVQTSTAVQTPTQEQSIAPKFTPTPIPSPVPITRNNVEQIELLSSFRYEYVGALSPDLKWVASVGDDAVIRVRDVKTGRLLQSHKVQYSSLAKVWDRVGSLVWSPHGDMFAFGRGEMVPQVWNLSEDTVHDIQEARIPYIDIIEFGKPKAWSTDGKLLAVTYQGWIWIWDLTTMKVVNTLVTNPVYNLAWSPDDVELAIGCLDNTVRIWDTGTWSQSRILSGHNGNVTGVAWAPNSSLLASTSDDGDVRIWDVESGETIERVEGPDGISAAVGWSPDGELIAIGGGDPWEVYPHQSGYVRVWDFTSMRLVKELASINRLVEGIAWSNDGSILAVTESEGYFSKWGVENP